MHEPKQPRGVVLDLHVYVELYVSVLALGGDHVNSDELHRGWLQGVC